MANTFKRLLSLVVVMVMLVGMIPGNAFTALATEETEPVAEATSETSGYIFEGQGTEADPFLLKDLEDLKAFRDSVNAEETTYSTPGVYVALGADIDMAGINWVGIGSATAEHGFMGNFDGNGFKIKNLTITNPTLDSDGYAYAGLFAVTEGTPDAENVIKDLIIENVTISTTGHIVAAAIAYPYYTTVEDVTVCGDIAIKGGDYTSGVLAYTRRCVNASNLTVSGNAGSTITGNITVGGVISDIQMNGGLTANYSNFAVSGVTITGEKNVGGISGIISAQTLDGATVKNVEIVCSDASAGTVSGSLGTTSTITNVVVENVTGADEMIGSIYDQQVNAAAKIGNTHYTTFAAAYAAANAGETITLLAPVVVNAGETLTLDKDVTITGTDNATGSFGLFTNKGELTITNGTITLTATNNRGWKAYSSVISNQPGGKLTVNGGTLEHLGGTDMAYAIDNLTNGKGTYAETIINGGTVKSTYRAIRQFLNGVEAQNILTVNGGTIEGANKSIWMQDPSKNANTGTLTVSENATLNGDVYLFVTEGSTEWPVEVSIAAAALKNGSDVLTGNVPEGLAVTKTNGTYGVVCVPELPSAIITSNVENDELTFAANFKADTATDAQLAYYGDWYADFVLTFEKDVTLNANGGADGYLSGQYDAWSKNWVNVPFENVTLKGGESLKVMEYAAEMMNKTGLKVTYNDVYYSVKDFDCGVFLEDSYIKAHGGETITLELRIYNPADETENYLIGKTYTYVIPPQLPTATVTQTENDELTFATNFKADTATDAQLAYYGDWYADFVLTFEKDVTLNANGGADGYLSGQYDAWSKNWVNVPFENVTLKGGESLKVMEYAAEMLNKTGLKVTYNDVYYSVKDFDCGVFLEDSYIKAHAGETITLELRIYNPADETESYVIGQTYTYTIPEITDAVAQNVQTGKIYDDAAMAALEAEEGQTVILLKDTKTAHLLVQEGTVFDLNGFTLEATYASVFGDMIDSSEANSGVLKVAQTKFLIQTDNKQLTIKTDKGYQFVEIVRFRTIWMKNPETGNDMFAFEIKFEEAAHEMMKNGVAVTGVNLQVLVTWRPAEGSEDLDSRIFKYGDTLVTKYINSYKPASGTYGNMFTLDLINPDKYVDLQCTAQLASDAGVEFSANEHAFGVPGIQATYP